MTHVKSIGLALAGLIFVVLSLAGIKFSQFSAMGNAGELFAMPPETVSAYEVGPKAWPNEFAAMGTVEAGEGITLAAEVPGRVARIMFESGEEVAAGKLLLAQDTSNERAQLNAAQARYNLALSTFERLIKLRANHTASQSELEAAEQQMLSSKGELENLQATLAKKQVRAPFAGRLGLRLVDLGQDLQVGTPIVSLQATQRVRVNFPVPQFWLSKFSSGLPVRVIAGDGSEREFNGVITAIGVEIDETTRNAMVQSSIDNRDGALIPGMAVTTRVSLSEPREVLAVPATAIVYAPYGDTVFVIEQNDQGQTVARQQFVKLGAARGDFVAIESGLEAGARIVSAGAFKLMNGALITVSDAPTPPLSETPTPANR
ncbi:efflux RND transporter periplasmic adaptor subunit [Simiduia sp. 21SJ11W-1]|uniref:efflux RND transporter periplasmic adaptor subunit n=1 Tax=Simiduia sp. 21SJ11W-1 TaxID=2909669 RepID=UPI00209C90B7|nr:efflux RND transporter periplasmic adaptor subunit [Simiduia sp. 21SJ11W-1]UTA47673.1 efflux RND transporter periplasmic adaptor subunit [Simiduia sp. 21SJ11W-1]